MTNLKFKMYTNSYCIFVVIVSCLLIPCASDDDSVCKKVGLCQCSFPNGLTINLSPLSRSRDASLVATLAVVTVYFHPCSDAPLGSSSASTCAEGASLCMYNKSSDTYSVVGKSADATFSSDALQNVFLNYNHLGKSAVIQLVCESANGAGSTLVINAINDSHTELVLKSPWVCSRLVMAGDVDPDSEMSTGSLLVILFFVFALIYAGGGALILKFLRGASGKR